MWGAAAFGGAALRIPDATTLPPGVPALQGTPGMEIDKVMQVQDNNYKLFCKDPNNQFKFLSVEVTLAGLGAYVDVGTAEEALGEPIPPEIRAQIGVLIASGALEQYCKGKSKPGGKTRSSGGGSTR